MLKITVRTAIILASLSVSTLVLAAGDPITKTQSPRRSEAVAITSCAADGLCMTPLLLDGDGITDLIIGYNLESHGTRYHRGLGGGVFRDSSDLGTGFRSSDFRVADLDGDGDLDMVESTRDGTNNVYTNDGTGSEPFFGLPPAAIDGSTDRSSSVAVADFDLDGKIDVVIGNETDGGFGGALQANLVYPNTTTVADSITFGAAIVIDPPADFDWTNDIIVFDIDGDGDHDIIAGNNGTTNDNRLYVNLTTGPGDFTFAAPVPLTVSVADDAEDTTSLAIGDIDGDLDLDLVVGNWLSPNRYYVNNSVPGTPDFDTTGTFGAAGDQITGIALGDLDADGDLDAVVTNFDGPNRIHKSGLAATATVGFSAATIDITDPPSLAVDDSREVVLADLNGDGSGLLDMIILNGSDAGNQHDLRYLNNATCGGAGDLCDPFLNDPPTITGDTGVSLDEDTSLDLSTRLSDLTVTDGDNAYPNDFTITVSGGANYSVLGTTITPDENFNSDVGGPLTVNVTVNDNEADSNLYALSVTVNAVEDIPEFTSVPVTAATQDVAYTYNITASDGDGDAITISADTVLPGWLSLLDNGDGTATLSGTPTQADVDAGDVDVTLRAAETAEPTDFMTQMFTITVANAPDAPTFTSTPPAPAEVDQDVLFSYAVTTEDLDGDAVTITPEGALPGWLSLVDNGDGTATLSGTPTNDDVGVHNVTLRVEDPGTLFSLQGPFAITVNNVNDAPTFTSMPPAPSSVDQGVLYSYAITTEDIDGDAVTITPEGALPGWLMLVDNGDGTATLSGTPTNDDVGVHNVTLRVEDPGTLFSLQGSFAITVNNVNDAPTFTTMPPAPAEVGLGGTFTYMIATTDIDGDAVAITPEGGLPGWLGLVDNGDGTAVLSGSPVGADVGVHNVTLRVQDTGGEFSLQGPFAITVNADLVPVITSNPITGATEATQYSYIVTAADGDGDAITLSAPTLPAWLTFVDNGDGTGGLVGTPAGSDVGDHPVEINALGNPLGGTAVQQFTITVAAAADGPTITLNGSASMTLNRGATFTDPGATASDPQDGDLTSSIVVTGAVDTAVVGTYQLDYTVSDTAGNQVTAQRVVTVRTPPPAPAPSSGGGGGSAGLLELAGLMLLAGFGGIRRRRLPAPGARG